MKRKLLVIYVIILILINNVQVKASDYANEWLAKKQKQQEEYLEQLEKEGNLSEEAIEATKLNVKKKANKKTKEENNNKNKKSDYTLVYGVDELHVTGLPTDERGYTRAGKYEK